MTHKGAHPELFAAAKWLGLGCMQTRGPVFLARVAAFGASVVTGWLTLVLHPNKWSDCPPSHLPLSLLPLLAILTMALRLK